MDLASIPVISHLLAFLVGRILPISRSLGRNKPLGAELADLGSPGTSFTMLGGGT
jgi:hypothetical protein